MFTTANGKNCLAIVFMNSFKEFSLEFINVSFYENDSRCYSCNYGLEEIKTASREQYLLAIIEKYVDLKEIFSI